MWGYTAIKRKSSFFVAFAVGKWTQKTCEELIRKLKRLINQPNKKSKLKILSDGNDDYRFVLARIFSPDVLDYGQLIKHNENGRLVWKEKRIVFGNMPLEEIETTCVEGYNGILRERLSCFVRRTKCIAKKKLRLENSLKFFQFYWNFVKTISGNETPAMREGICGKIWTWEKFLWRKLSVFN